MIEHNRPAGGRALIERKDVLPGHASPSARIMLLPNLLDALAVVRGQVFNFRRHGGGCIVGAGSRPASTSSSASRTRHALVSR